MECLECGYSTKRPCDWQRHLKSQKHYLITGHVCSCGNVYTTKAHLIRHASKCNQESVQSVLIRHAREHSERDEKIASDARRVATESSIQHAAEIASLRAELATRPTIINNNCTFNLSVFLNDTCKNAQTIEQFMGSIPLRMDSEQSIGQFILDSLNRCAIEDRPIHCTDLKRCKLAVKHGDNVWEQDQTKVDPLMALNVNTLRQRYIRHLSSVWCPENPKYLTDDTLNTEWLQFLSMMCRDLDDKFMNHVAKATPIPKI